MYSEILEKLKIELNKITLLEELKKLRLSYLGKNGSIKLLLKQLANLSPQEKRRKGPEIQKIQKEAVQLFAEKEKELKNLRLKNDLKSQAEELDFRIPKIGHLHPLTEIIRKLNKIFISLGYSIMDGPEIETDEYCFKRLNVPFDHPARDMQDTIYIEEPNYLLRTQTSSIEARVLAKYQPPLKVVAAGKVFRNEKPNASNHFIFHHYQGFIVAKNITLKDLFATFNLLFKKMYGQKVVIRYRNKYYPEVEPGVGADMRCFQCQGRGCGFCKNVGWIEMAGAGIIHPYVLKMAGINPNQWRGFAFGLGLDRFVMAKYKIKDIRTLLAGNLGYKYYETAL